MTGVTKLAPGDIFAGDYCVERVLREGGMGAVYVAEQLSTGSKRALKLMHSELVAHERLLELFMQEARVGSLIRSDHVVQVIDAGVDDETHAPWLAMELLSGEVLSDRLDRLGLLPEESTREIMMQVCHALAAAHRVGVVHRDIKPENIFIAEPQREGVRMTVKVLDFGIAKILENAAVQKTLPGCTRIGTPFWMAPEQELGGAISTAADVWALGLLAFRLLTGRRYWTSSPSDMLAIQRELLHGPLVSASARAAEYGCAARIPPGFDGWFAQCVVRDSKRRYAHAGVARDVLEEILDGETAPPPSTRQPESEVQPPSDPDLPPQPAGASYDPRWYIPREQQEREALNYLGFPGTPAVLFGPDRYGKTWLLSRCIAQLEKQQGYESVVINFRVLGRRSLDQLLVGLATSILQKRDLPPHSISTTWKGPGSAMQKITRLMEQEVLPAVASPLVLALDDVDVVTGSPFQDAFFALLRSWAESSNEHWSKLRLVLAVSTTPAQLIDDPNRSPFNLTAPIVLGDLSVDQVVELGRRYRLTWSRYDIEQVMRLVGGHPYLIRQLMHRAALQATPLSELVDWSLGARWILHNELQRIRAALKRLDLFDLTARFEADPSEPLASGEIHRLVRAGVIVEKTPGVFRLRDGLHSLAARDTV